MGPAQGLVDQGFQQPFMLRAEKGDSPRHGTEHRHVEKPKQDLSIANLLQFETPLRSDAQRCA